jgi:hypothetical protein
MCSSGRVGREQTSFAACIDINIVVAGSIMANELQGRGKMAYEFVIEQAGNLFVIERVEKIDSSVISAYGCRCIGAIDDAKIVVFTGLASMKKIFPRSCTVFLELLSTIIRSVTLSKG